MFVAAIAILSHGCVIAVTAEHARVRHTAKKIRRR
jgi:hypothetical protein